ncbi:unnamed protein product, partial [Adineta steineri]
MSIVSDNSFSTITTQSGNHGIMFKDYHFGLRNNNSKGNGHYQSHLQIDVLKSTQIQLDQAQDQNHRLHNEIKLLQNELTNKVQLINHYEKQISLLEKQINSRN